MWWRSPWLRRRSLLLGLAAFDLVAVTAVYNVVYRARFSTWPGFSGAVLGLIGLWLSASYLLGRYSRARPRQTNGERWLITFGIAVVVLGVVAGGLRWGLDVDDSRTVRSFALPIVGSIAVLSAIAQTRANWLLQQPQHWILIANQADLNLILAELREDSQEVNLQLTAVESSTLAGTTLDYLAPTATGIAVSEQSSLDEENLQQLLALRGEGTRVVSLLSWAEQVLQRVPPELFDSRWLVHAEGFELQPERFSWRLKRLGDLALGSLLLLAALPVMASAAILIKMDDGGPIFYRQVRTGLYGERITILKLRSMAVDAEPQGARWARANDQRITRFGRWLRRLRIDELPQLLSVLRGDMSLIGPRPERPELEDQLESAIPHYRVRHWIRPGLSGWAQVCYPYGASLEDSRQKLSYDLYYLRNASLPLDLLILFKTIRMILRGQGAEPRSKSLDRGR